MPGVPAFAQFPSAAAKKCETNVASVGASLSDIEQLPE
jgi:hypothetical protein